QRMRRDPSRRTPRRGRRPGRRRWPGRALALFLSAWMAAGCASFRTAPRLPTLTRRGVLDGVGYARIENGDVARARKRAIQAALRDMALSARAVVRTRSTYRISAQDGKPATESLDDLVEVSAFQVLASRHMREDVDARAGVYRVYLWLTEEELRDSIEQTRLARKEALARARRAYEAVKAEAERDPLAARKKLRGLLGSIEDAGPSAAPDGPALHARLESLLGRVEDRIREGNRLYARAERALREGRLATADRWLQAARKRLPDAARSQKLEEGIGEKRRRVSELKREAANLRGENRLEAALKVYREAAEIDREDPEIQEAITELRTLASWEKKRRNRKIASAVAGFFIVLGAVALAVVAAASGTYTAQTGYGTWRR
ncbi:MAG: hypothetical protein ACE5IM_07755, partial [Nitrospinota bacterium]